MYDKNFDISKMIIMTDIMIFCNIAPPDHGPIHDHVLAGHAIEESGVTLLSFISKQHMTTLLART